MHIVIMGTGGLGGYFGGLLARHYTNVTFIARGANLHALQERGLSCPQCPWGFHSRGTRLCGTVRVARRGFYFVLCQNV